MSTLTPSSVDLAATPVAGTFCVRWTISAQALLASEPSRAMMNGHASTLSDAALLILVSSRSLSATLVLRSRSGAEDQLPIRCSGLSGAPVFTHESGRVHIDVPGELSMSIDTTSKHARLLYASTPLLIDHLALPGGVYDQPELISPGAPPAPVTR